MSQLIPSNTGVITASWRDLVRVVRDMPLQCLIALGICTGVSMLDVTFGTLGKSALSLSVREIGIRIAVDVAEAFLLTPLLIAVHRLIILGERPSGYSFALGTPRFMRFVGWSAALVLGTSLVTAAPVALMADSASRIISILVLAVVSTVVSIRVVLLFPALAVDAPGGGWSNSWADTRGQGINILLIFVGAFLPLIIVSMIAVHLTLGSLAVDGAGDSALAAAVLHATASAITYVLAVVIASRLYGWLADKTRRGAIS